MAKSPAPRVILPLPGEQESSSARQGALPHPAPRRAPKPAHGRVVRGHRHHRCRVLLREGHHPAARGAGAPWEAAPDHQPDRRIHDVHAGVALHRYRAGDADHPVRDLRVHRSGASEKRAAVPPDAGTVRAPALRRWDGLLLFPAAAQRHQLSVHVRERRVRGLAARERIHLLRDDVHPLASGWCSRCR